MPRPILEICCYSVESAMRAEQSGADRIELCDNYPEGGTTPSYGAIQLALERLTIPVNVIVRPRGGDFLYTEAEYKIIKQDVSAIRELGANGVVVGFLKPDGAGNDLILAIRSDDKPATWPAFNSLTLDDENRLWVSTISDNQENYEWWVLDDAGKLLAKFSWPRNRDLKQVKNGYAYTMERDMKTKLQEVVRYKINIEM